MTASVVDRQPLSLLPRALIAAGYEQTEYRRLYMAAVDRRIPVKRGNNGRWTFDPADLGRIAEGAGIRPVVVPQRAQAPAAPVEPDYHGETETVSYNLPKDLIELFRDLAEERLRKDRHAKRVARRNGEKPPQARRSASAIVREAMEAHRAKVEAELRELRGRR